MDCPLSNTFLLTFRTLVWRILQVRALTVVSCCWIFPNPSQQHSKRQTRGEEIVKCLHGSLEPTYNFSIFSKIHNCSCFKFMLCTFEKMKYSSYCIKKSLYVSRNSYLKTVVQRLSKFKFHLNTNQTMIYVIFSNQFFLKQ